MKKKTAVKKTTIGVSVVPAVPASEAKPEVSFHPPSGFLAVLCYLISFISPLTGVVLGAVFMPQHNPKAKEFGRNCFMIAAAAILLGIIFLAAVLMSGGYASSGLKGFIVKEGYF